MLALSAGILAHNWRCVALVWMKRSPVPGFVHVYGAIPAAAAIGLGITPFLRSVFWVPLLLDPAGALYLIGLLRYLFFQRD